MVRRNGLVGDQTALVSGCGPAEGPELVVLVEFVPGDEKPRFVLLSCRLVLRKRFLTRPNQASSSKWAPSKSVPARNRVRPNNGYGAEPGTAKRASPSKTVLSNSSSLVKGAPSNTDAPRKVDVREAGPAETSVAEADVPQ